MRMRGKEGKKEKKVIFPPPPLPPSSPFYREHRGLGVSKLLLLLFLLFLLLFLRHFTKSAN